MRALAYFGTRDIRFTTDLPEPVIEKPDDVLIDIVSVSYTHLCNGVQDVLNCYINLGFEIHALSLHL